MLRSPRADLKIVEVAAYPTSFLWPLDRPGLGLEVNEEFLKKHPAIDGPGYI